MEPTLINEPVDTGAWMAASGLYTGLIVILVVVAIIGLYRVFEKAGEPGWTAIIPIYNWYEILKITGRPWWWLILLFIPVVNTITWWVMMYNLAKAFGRGILFTLGLIIFPAIWFIILGFGGDEYRGFPSRLQTGNMADAGPFSPGPGQ
jgi:hypothetical protein